MAWNFVYYLVSILACGLSQSNALQIPLSSGQNTCNNSNLIFASLHSLLNAPHGHAIVPVTIKTGTLLYNMGGKRPPPTMGYFARVCYNNCTQWRSLILCIADLMPNIAITLGAV